MHLDLSTTTITGHCSQSEHYVECQKLETTEFLGGGNSKRTLTEKYVLLRHKYLLNQRSFYFSSALPIELLTLSKDGTIQSKENHEYNDSYAQTAVTLENGDHLIKKELSAYNQAGLKNSESSYEWSDSQQKLQLKSQTIFQYDPTYQFYIGEELYQWDEVSNEMKLVKSSSLE